jgi:cob(I)alamin adenosyltransferase
MKIYTKTGDKGKTRLGCGCLVSKSDLRIDAYGGVDELNSVLGILTAELLPVPELEPTRQQLLRIQNELFNIGSLFACEDPTKISKLPAVTEESIEQLEKEIDAMTETLPPLKNFILPGGSRFAAFFHLARTVCRRAERSSVKLYDQHPEVEKGMVYLNRLSDYLFTAARFANKNLHVTDQIWAK